MLGFPNPAILAGGATGRTYAEWLAHIAARATGGAANWQGEYLAGSYRTTANPDPGISVMSGSPWLSHFRQEQAYVARAIQHAMPSEAVFNAVCAAGTQVFFRTLNNGIAASSALNRNGYESVGASAQPSLVMPEMAWWDYATQSALMMNPQAGTGPVPYAAPGW